jgi:hypothetical protein
LILALPALTLPEAQIQRKYARHAADLGVTLPNNREGREAFRAAVLAHVDSPDTFPVWDRVPGGKRRPSTRCLTFWNPDTGIGAIFKLDGVFISAWRFSAAQAECVRNCRRVIWALED